jgi:SAM-dependent methyltransferase
MNNGKDFGVAAHSYLRDDKHWGSDLDVLKSALDSQLKKRRQLTYLDLGCGPGFHVAAMKSLYPEVSVSGLDYSAEMLHQARNHMSTLQLDVSLKQGDILDFPDETHDVVSFLNNGLGNLQAEARQPSEVRDIALLLMRKRIRRHGSLVVSVYHLEKLKHPYGRHIQILPKSDIENGELFLKYTPSPGTTAEFYSHWFVREELVGLLERKGFRVDLLEERMARLLVRATAV